MVSEKSLKIFLGTGGVGKTTLSSVYALKLSLKNQDKKIKLITIDPSKRLKDYFSLEIGQEKVFNKNLTVSMKSRESLLKSFVSESFSGDDEKIAQVYSNKIFKKLMSGLSVSQEFTSIYEIYKSQKEGFDFLVVDTPPLQNAGAFLNGVDELEGLFSSSIIKFFIPPNDQGLIYRVFHKAQKKSFEVLSKLTGASFVSELESFFETVEVLRPKILEIIKMVRSDFKKRTDLFCVCNYTELSMAGLKLSLKDIESSGFIVDKSFINKFEENEKADLFKQKKLKSLYELKSEDHFTKIIKFGKTPHDYFDLMKLGEEIEF